MNVSSDSKIEISFWIAWALTIAHEASEYTEQKFNADKTGGDLVIPSPHLDTDLVMDLSRNANLDLPFDHLNALITVQMQINIVRYSKLISPKDTGHNEEREKMLLDRSPPGNEGTMFIDVPTTVLDVTSILSPLLPNGYRILNILQEEIWKATQLLTPTLEKSVKVAGSWWTNEEWFGEGSRNSDITAVCINISPTWFQQGHETISDPEVSASLKGPHSEEILKAIVRLAAIASAALRVMHPRQYWAGMRAFSSLGESAETKNLPNMSETLKLWASIFNTLSVISNRQTPYHRDHLSSPKWFDILTTVGELF
ncbi:uncharacterized protein EDB91DRAFT_1255022 [Suillus paluster]|uniref:uncharacterized protein n=1 Tax=Suillus paluster TaxID=48578 RepID=UPI001B87EA1B|nr:uncharacterized protein EDB91DRAFT_1255022 [Suillus paluster]KAG1724884.1 hypothetical protein EDB91DRAFT_1255022 [Suillus paluster]